jgi:hypothetical protein
MDGTAHVAALTSVGGVRTDVIRRTTAAAGPPGLTRVDVPQGDAGTGGGGDLVIRRQIGRARSDPDGSGVAAASVNREREPASLARRRRHHGRTVLVRADLNVPLGDGVVEDDFASRRHYPPSSRCAGLRLVVVCSHLAVPRASIRVLDAPVGSALPRSAASK